MADEGSRKGGNNLVFGIVLVVATTIVNQGLDLMGVGFFKEIGDRVITRIQKEEKYLTEDAAKELIGEGIKARPAMGAEDLAEAIKLSMADHLKSSPHETIEADADQPRKGLGAEQQVEVLVYWAKVGAPEKGKLLLNGINATLRERTEYGQPHLASVGDGTPKVLTVVYGDLVTASGNEDIVGRLHMEDFKELFGELDVGTGFLKVRRL